MQFTDVDQKIQEFMVSLSERVQILQINRVPNNDNIEEYEIVGLSNGAFPSSCFIWKNPDKTYGWSNHQNYQSKKQEKFMGDVKC